MNNMEDYYLNPNTDGNLQDFLDRVLSRTKINPAINIKSLTRLAIADCIDAAIDYHNKTVFLLLSQIILDLNRVK